MPGPGPGLNTPHTTHLILSYLYLVRLSSGSTLIQELFSQTRPLVATGGGCWAWVENNCLVFRNVGSSAPLTRPPPLMVILVCQMHSNLELKKNYKYIHSLNCHHMQNANHKQLVQLN